MAFSNYHRIQTLQPHFLKTHCEKLRRSCTRAGQFFRLVQFLLLCTKAILYHPRVYWRNCLLLEHLHC